MYDTQFMMDTFDLKRRIQSRTMGPDSAASIGAEFEARRSKLPFVFNIETTSHCNMSCLMCQRTTDFQRKPEHMSDSTFEAILSQIKPQTTETLAKWRDFSYEKMERAKGGPFTENDFYFDVVSSCVTLHGFGEPLLDKKLPERIAALGKLGVNTYFSCNPCNIKIDFFRRLFEAGAGYIKLAMDSLDDAEAKKFRGGNADFSKSYQNVLDVLKLKEEMSAKTKIVMTMLNISGRKEDEGKFLSLWKGRDVLAYVKSVDNKWLMSLKGEKDYSERENKSHYAKQYCEFPWTSITILADGSVVPCTQDINAKWNFGNINKMSFEEIWNSPKYQEFRRLHLSADAPSTFMCKASCDICTVAGFYKR